MPTTPPEPPPHHSGPRRVLYVTLGWLFVGLAVLGAFLPVLPTTPFLLVASGCFARSSPALNRWLARSPLFGPLLHDWQRYRGIRPHVRATAVTVIVGVGAISALWGGLPPWLLAVLIGL